MPVSRSVSISHWCEIWNGSARSLRPASRRFEGLTSGLGEIEVLAVVLERPGVIAVLDDALARRAATELGVRITGTLGILLSAKRAGHIVAVTPHLDRLQNLGFRL